MSNMSPIIGGAGGDLRLINDSMADALHRHSELSASDGSPNPALQVDADGGIDWLSGNVIQVPIGGDIHAYISSATAGDTLVLSSGTYAINTPLTLSKSLNIIGQGISKTVISCSTSDMDVIKVSSDNVHIGNLSIKSTSGGTYARGVNISAVSDTVYTSVIIEDVEVSMSGVATTQQAIRFSDSGGIVKNCSITMFGSVNAYGIYKKVESTAEAPTPLTITSSMFIIESYGSTYGIYVQGVSSTQDSIVNVFSCFVKAFNGSISNEGLSSYTSVNAILYADKCVVSATGTSAYDVLQNSSAVVILRDCVLVNGTVSGTITYEGKVVTENLYIDDKLGIGTTAPDRKLEINVGAATDGIRLAYNDADGSAINYVDLLVDSNGDLTVTPSGGDVKFTGNVQLNGSTGVGIRGDSSEHTYYDPGMTDYNHTFHTRTNTTASLPRFVIEGGDVIGKVLVKNALLGIGTTAPNRKLEINTGASTGGIRIAYNDADGSATVYADLLVDSSGNLALTPTGNVNVDGIAIKDGSFALGSDADGDIYYRASGALARLGKGTASQVLAMNSGATAPEWVAPSGGGGRSIHTEWTDAAEMFALTTDTNFAPLEKWTLSNQEVMVRTFADGATYEYTYFRVPIPSDLNASTGNVNIRLFVSHVTASSSDSFAWNLDYQALTTGETTDYASWNALVDTEIDAVDDTANGVTVLTKSVALSGLSIAASDIVFLRFWREGDDESDDLLEDIGLIGIEIEWDITPA